MGEFGDWDDYGGFGEIWGLVYVPERFFDLIGNYFVSPEALVLLKCLIFHHTTRL